MSTKEESMTNVAYTLNEGKVVGVSSEGNAPSKETYFQRLSLEGINPEVTENPVLRMLIQGDAILASGRRCTVIPEDEMLMFLD